MKFSSAFIIFIPLRHKSWAADFWGQRIFSGG